MNHTQLKLDEIAHIATNKGATVTYDISCVGQHDYEDVIILISSDCVINYMPDKYGVVSTLITTNEPNVMIRVSFYRGFNVTPMTDFLNEQELTAKARVRGAALEQFLNNRFSAVDGDVYSNPFRDMLPVYDEPSKARLRLIPSKGNGPDLEHD